MKTVDAKYSYDELEGFEPVDLKRQALQGEIWLSMWDRNLSFSKEARKIIFGKKYILIAFNREAKKLLVTASSNGGPNAVCLPAVRSLQYLMQHAAEAAGAGGPVRPE